ncbi:hypothetical protein ACS0TY_027632 [Phlomoides rotata]
MYPLNTLHLQKIFQKLDKDGDGLVTIDELMWLLQRTGLQCNRDELELLVGDSPLGPLDFIFFYQILMNEVVHGEIQEDEMLERDLRKAFRVFDLNDDGFISCEELKIALSRLGLWDEGCGQDCKKMIGAYDSNSDGLLDFEEFKVMMFLDSLDSS